MSATIVKKIRSLVQADWDATDHLILNELTSDVPLIQEISKHIVHSGGKRLRALMVILAANCLNIQSNEHHELAAVIEFIHTATLLHDDVVDRSELRRGQETANSIWGNQASVLVGDFLYSRAFQILARRSNVPVSHELAHATNALSEGEVMQLIRQTQADLTEADYYEIIYRKTARLFESACKVGALVATDNTSNHKALATYGKHFGMAYQIIDDVLDYSSNSKTLGKNIGDDLNEGKTTLPLIYAMHTASTTKATLIQNAIESKDLSQLAHIQAIIEETHAVKYCTEKAWTHTHKAKAALAPLPASAYKEALIQLMDFAITRNF